MLQSSSLRPTIFRIPRFVCLRARGNNRNKSITAAIERGRSSSDRDTDRGRSRNRETFAWGARAHSKPVRTGFARSGRDEPPKPYKTSPDSLLTYESAYTKDNDQFYSGRDRERRTLRAESLPYTTAASEFIYGYSSVLAALKANRRKLYKLYIHTRGSFHAGNDALIKRARSLGIQIEEVGDETLQSLDKASSGRPHNGFVLEASPLPVPPLTSLLSSRITSGRFEVALGSQSKEDIMVNGNQTEYMYKSAGWRHPLVLYVDGVLDEGNLGAIARSAYFLGADAIVTPTRSSAPWSHIALKASAGAAEALPIFKANHSTDFLGQSARAGWRIYASDAIPPGELPSLQATSSNAPQAASHSSVIYTQARSAKRLPVEHCPVESYPTILMMGAEGAGLRSSLLNLAHFKVGIRHGRDVDEIGVDSLNVSVAASLLCYEMLQKPKPRPPMNLLF
ncbi:alpha/beta knot [Bimuria novae-zelandiae CBS 107.79]|uniref:rRNA methyltransferase 1, mitochondrial n=1 Tax=Bimuria novae-zelandiae CBS 107.79 TaxID=1447943 RepID=A0A6A5VNY7_9PLEO|nr:alpha/beta knot [Bimuria novae-zelandiae CBS 107.79]